MTTMLERAARAVFYAMPRDPEREGLDCDTWEEMWQDGVDVNSCFHVVARAVLMAVREPDMDVRMIGRNAVLRGGGSPFADYSVAVGNGFTAMIDAILNEGSAE